MNNTKSVNNSPKSQMRNNVAVGSLSGEEIRHTSMQKVDSFYIRKPEESNHRLSKTQMQPVRAMVHCFFYLTDGEAIVDIGERNYVLRRYECAIIPTGQIFTVKSYERCKGYMGGFSNEFLLAGATGNNFLNRFDFLTIWANHKISFADSEAKYINNIFDRIFEEFSDTAKDTNIIRFYLIALLSEINKVYKRNLSKDLNNAEKITNNFKKILFENSRKNMSVAEYASLLNVTPNHLNKTIKNTTGKSPSKWISELLVTEAKILLYQTNLTVSEIAVNVGILDQSYFSRLFKKCEGISPVEFRKMIEKS
jgi:AraC-like DNA-binding protein